MLVIFGETGLRTKSELRALLAEAGLLVTRVVGAGSRQGRNFEARWRTSLWWIEGRTRVA